MCPWCVIGYLKLTNTLNKEESWEAHGLSFE